MNTLSGKVAIITGASSGIGRATAKLFAAEGAQLVLAARRETELRRLVDEIAATGGTARALGGDVQDEQFARALVACALSEFGALDIAFNNAATLGPLGATPDVLLADWQQALTTNLTGAFLGAKHQIPAMLKRGAGALIFTSTFVGHTAAYSGVAAYAASKAGLVGLTQALAVEFGRHNIRVNALLPGGTDTPMARQMISTQEAWSALENLYALGRLATADEQARAALFLASDAASFVTGTALLVDGGISVYRG